MKWMKRMLGVLFSMVLLFSMALPVGAAESETTYTIRIYPGSKGAVRAGGECIEYTNCKYGDWISFTQNQIVQTDGKYSIKGIRESGKDNNTATSNPAFQVTGDRDYVVAYNLLNDAVAYTIRYQNLAGEALLPDEVYYGNVGERPVIAYQYIEGYQPQAYNLTRELSSNAAENVFTFVYLPITSEVIRIPAAPVTPPAPAEPVTPPVEPVVPPVPGEVDIPDEPVPLGPFRPTIGEALERLVDIDDNAVPEGNFDGVVQVPEDLIDLDENKTPLSPFGGEDAISILNGNAFLVWIPMPVKIGILVLFVLLVALGVRQLVKAKAGKKE